MEALVFNLTYPKYGNYLYMAQANKWHTQMNGANKHVTYLLPNSLHVAMFLKKKIFDKKQVDPN